MNKETIHLIKGYLGYEVECECMTRHLANPKTVEIYDSILDKVIFDNGRGHYFYKYIKPILRPIEYLTDEEIKQLWYEMPSYLDNVNYNKERTLSHLFDNIQSLDYQTMEYLSSIHIDYFGLISQGLAIKKETK